MWNEIWFDRSLEHSMNRNHRQISWNVNKKKCDFFPVRCIWLHFNDSGSWHTSKAIWKIKCKLLNQYFNADACTWMTSISITWINTHKPTKCKGVSLNSSTNTTKPWYHVLMHHVGCQSELILILVTNPNEKRKEKSISVKIKQTVPLNWKYGM